jgi:hypothetical protein
LVGLVATNLAILVATRSPRSAVVASVIATALAVILVLGAVGSVEQLNGLGNGVD